MPLNLYFKKERGLILVEKYSNGLVKVDTKPRLLAKQAVQKKDTHSEDDHVRCSCFACCL